MRSFSARVLPSLPYQSPIRRVRPLNLQAQPSLRHHDLSTFAQHQDTPWWFWAPRYPWWSYPPWHLGSHSEPRHTLTWIPPPHPCISDFSLDWCYLTLSLAIKNEGISNDTDLEVIMTIQWYHNTSRRETSTWFLTNIEWRSVTSKATSSRHHLVKETAAWYHLTPYCLLTAYRQKFWHWYLPMRVLNENIKRIFSFRNDFG